MKHSHEAPWDAAAPGLSTCSDAAGAYVSHGMPPQPVDEGRELIFTYDVKFVVRCHAGAGARGPCFYFYRGRRAGPSSRARLMCARRSGAPFHFYA